MRRLQHLIGEKILLFVRSIQTPVGRATSNVETALAMPTIAISMVVFAFGWTEESINQSKLMFATWKAEREVHSKIVGKTTVAEDSPI